MNDKSDVKKFANVTEAASYLSQGSYSGTIAPAHDKSDVKKFANVTEAASYLSQGSYSGTIAPAHVM